MKLNLLSWLSILTSFLVYGFQAHPEESLPGINNNHCNYFTCAKSAIVRGDTTQKALSIVFTGGDYADGGEYIRKVLKSHGQKASFFFTGDFYRNPDFIFND